MMTLEEVSSLEGLEALRGDWEEAQARAAPDNVFAAFDWALAWWRSFGGGRRLRVLVLRKGARPAGILPLWEGPLWRPWTPFRKIQILGTGLSDRLDLLLPEDPVDSAERALRHLLARPARWDLIDLREIAEGSPAVDAIRQAATRLGLENEVSLDSESPYLPIDSDWETFFSTHFGQKGRKRIRYNARRLAAEKEPVFRVVDASADARELLSRLAAMPQDRDYGGARRRSIFAAGPKRTFFEEIARRFSDRGWLHVGLLELGEDVAAYSFSFLYAGKHCYYFTGFHRDYARLSPGAVLLARVIEDCFRNGVREVDFLRGTEPWKTAWTDRRRKNLRVRVYRPGWHRSALRLLMRVRERARAEAADAASSKAVQCA